MSFHYTINERIALKNAKPAIDITHVSGKKSFPPYESQNCAHPDRPSRSRSDTAASAFSSRYSTLMKIASIFESFRFYSIVPKGHLTSSLFTITYYFPKIDPPNLEKVNKEAVINKNRQAPCVTCRFLSFHYTINERIALKNANSHSRHHARFWKKVFSAI